MNKKTARYGVSCKCSIHERYCMCDQLADPNVRKLHHITIISTPSITFNFEAGFLNCLYLATKKNNNNSKRLRQKRRKRRLNIAALNERVSVTAQYNNAPHASLPESALVGRNTPLDDTAQLLKYPHAEDIHKINEISDSDPDNCSSQTGPLLFQKADSCLMISDPTSPENRGSHTYKAYGTEIVNFGRQAGNNENCDFYEETKTNNDRCGILSSYSKPNSNSLLVKLKFKNPSLLALKLSEKMTSADSSTAKSLALSNGDESDPNDRSYADTDLDDCSDDEPMSGFSTQSLHESSLEVWDFYQLTEDNWSRIHHKLDSTSIQLQPREPFANSLTVRIRYSPKVVTNNM